MLIPVTALTASILALFYMRLALAVVKLRRANQVSLGHGEHSDLERAIRAHGNFSEYVPIALILFGALELNGAPWWIVALLCITFLAGRLLHAKGIHDLPPRFDRRKNGMVLTLNSIGLAAIGNIILIILKILNIL